jgi:RHS repeat-associated protein
VVCDHLGTPLSLHDAQGAVTWELTLDSYGGVRQGKGKAQDCPFRYSGQYEDIETGLYYNRFRYYDPETGQYISQDPIRLEGGANVYNYVHDTSLWVDTYGLAPCRGANGRFEKAQTASDEIASLPSFGGKTRGNIRKGLKGRGYTKIKSNNGDETWIRSAPDGKLAVARMDAPVSGHSTDHV